MQPTRTARIKITRITTGAWLLAFGLLAAAPLAAPAQFAQPLGSLTSSSAGSSNTGSSSTGTTGTVSPEMGPNGPIGYQGAAIPEPPGAGPTPASLISGDSTAATTPASNQAQTNPIGGSMFSTTAGMNRTIIHIYHQTTSSVTGQSRGVREVQTIRLDQLSPQVASQIQSLLGVGGSSNQGNIECTVTNSQLEQLNALLAPYPGYQTSSAGRKQITQDQPASGYPKSGEQNNYNFQGPLPTVRTFCRYLVILGVVAATIWVAMGATAMTMGDGYGASRVVGAIAGLMMLLCGYSIWKVVQMNTFNANSNLYLNQSRTTDGEFSTTSTPNLPAVPQGIVPGPTRFGIPLVPLGDVNPNSH